MRVVTATALSLLIVACERRPNETAKQPVPPHSNTSRASQPNMKECLRTLLETMERLADRFPEIGETHNREPMHLAIYNGFVAQTPNYVLPNTFYLEADEANQAVREALGRFITDAKVAANREGINTHAARYNAFQDSSVQTKHESTFDEFFGYWPHPERPPGNR